MQKNRYESFDTYVKHLNSLFDSVKRTEDDLDDYQWDAIDFIIKKKNGALFIDTGLGKTAIVLFAIRYLLMRGLIQNVLITSTLKITANTWGEEIANWSYAAPLTYKQIRSDELVKGVNLAGQKERKRLQLGGLPPEFKSKAARLVSTRMNKLLKENPDNRLNLDEVKARTVAEVEKEGIQYLVDEARRVEAARLIREQHDNNPTTISLVNQENIDFVVEAWGDDWPYDVIVYDESSGLKNSKSSRWKAFNRIRPLVNRFIQMTATPNSESDYADLYGQITLLDGGERLGRNIHAFEEKFMNINRYTRAREMKDGAVERINELISDITLVMLQEDYGDIPDPTFNDIIVPLGEDAANKYEQMANGGVVTVDDGTVIMADSVATMLQKMMQICSGFVYEGVEELDEDGMPISGRIVHDIHDHKIEALRKLREQYPNEPMLVSYTHKRTLSKILDAFPDAVKMDTKGYLQKEWNEGKIPMLLMHPQSGAHGLNLQFGGRHVVNFDTFYRYELYYQFWRRLCRRGQKDPVIVHNILIENSYDMVVKKQCWIDKKSDQSDFFKQLKKIRSKSGLQKKLLSMM